MPIIQHLVSHDKLYHTTQGEKILINNIDVFNEEQRELIDKCISKNYTDDNISLIPSCICGVFKGAYYIGETCNKCNTKVSHTVESNLSYLMWCKQPIGVQKFINPIVFTLLDERFRGGKPTLYLMRWLINPWYVVTKDMLKNLPEVYFQMVEFLKVNKLERGYNMFVENFDLILDTLFSLKNKTNKANKGDLSIYNLIKQNRDCVFSEYMPFPNKFLIIFESTELGKFIDKTTVNPVNVVRRLSGIDISSRSLPVKQARVANSIIDLCSFYKEYLKKSIFSKSGLVRQNLISARAHFTARAVITSLSGVHEYDELHIPWVIGCAIFREVILNKLMRRGIAYNNALSFLIEHSHIYNSLLDTIFQELLVEGSIDNEYGVPVLFNRNPSLQRGSIQRHRITKVKTDTTDQTIGLSILVLKPYNADFDGDEMSLTLIKLPKVIKALRNFDVHLNMLTLTGPNAFSNNMSFCKPEISTIANWLRSP